MRRCGGGFCSGIFRFFAQLTCNKEGAQRSQSPTKSVGPDSLTRASRDVHQFLQLFAGPEVRNLFRGHLDAGSGLGIASNPRLSLAGAEGAKPSDLSFFASAQGLHDAVED